MSQPEEMDFIDPWWEGLTTTRPVVVRTAPPEQRAAVPLGNSTPTPLTKVPAPPAFPLDALGGSVGAMVEALAEATQTDTGLVGTMALGCLAAAAGGRVVVEVRKGWDEPTNLFVAAVAQPGSRKSGAVRELLAPLVAAERLLEEQVHASIVEAETDREIAARAAEAARKKAGNASSAEQRAKHTAEAVDAARTAAGIEVPPKARLLADDATPELLATLMYEHGGRLAVIAAEGGLFDLLAGRYSKNPNIDSALKGHAGDTLRVDRRGRTERVDRPALTLALAIQPAVIDSIGQVSEFSGRGLLARFLFAIPPSNIGHRRVDVDPVPDQVRQRYVDELRDLTVALDGWRNDPARLQLTPEAQALHQEAMRRLEPELLPHRALGDNQAVIEWSSKLLGAVARLAGLLHLIDHGADGAVNRPISADVMRRALRLGDYFTAHAMVVFDRMGADSTLDAAREVLKHLHAKGHQEISVRDLFTEVPRRRFPNTGVLRDALRILEDHGWVEEAPAEERQGPGRKPSPIVRVHPMASAQSAESSRALSFSLSADSADSAAQSAGGAQ